MICYMMDHHCLLFSFTAELALVLEFLPGFESKVMLSEKANWSRLRRLPKEQGDRGFGQRPLLSQPSVLLPHTVNLFQRGKAGHLTLDK